MSDQHSEGEQSRSLLPRGMQVDDYQVVELIGTGAYGNVYEAKHRLIGKRAAIKVLHGEHVEDQEVTARFLDEARAVNEIQHNGIVDIFAFGKLDDGRHYFAMELLEGKTLEQRLEGEPLGLEEALTILRRVARALDAAHAAGIAHRDLKPENVYLTYDEEGEVRPKLLDFGIAKLMHGGGELGRTAPGQVMGTPLFMAPEQWRGKKVGPQTDVFALGVLAYHMLSGDYPHRGEAPGDIMVKACMEPHRPIRDFRPDLSPAVDEAFAVILAKDAAERPATAKAAVELLQAALLDEDAALLDTQDGDVPPVPSSEAEEPAPAKEPASTKEPALPPISAEPASLAHERASKPPGIGSLGLRILIGIVLAIAALLYWFGAP